jgi:hypothetical protein
MIDLFWLKVLSVIALTVFMYLIQMIVKLYRKDDCRILLLIMLEIAWIFVLIVMAGQWYQYLTA